MTFKRIRFVTDSTSDIPRDIVARHGIGVVPCYINYGGNSYADDGVEFNREDFYAQMPHIRPLATTSAPPPGIAERIVKETFEGADHLIVVCVPAKLSGVFNTLRLAASSLPQDRVTMIDSGTTAMAQGWQVIIGAEAAEATGDVGAAVDAVHRVRANQRLYAVLPTLDYLRASGRVGWAAASIGALLQIKPIIEVRESEVPQVARVRTFGKAIEELIHLTQAQAPLDRLAVLHTNNLDGAQALQAQLAGIAPPDTIIVNATPAVGTHAGPGALGVATVSKSWRA